MEKCCPKNKYYQFKLKFCTKPYSNMHNSMVMIISCFLDRKCSFWANLLQKIKIKIVRPATLLKKRLWNRCFPVNFAKFLRTPFYRTPLVDCFWLFHFSNVLICLLLKMISMKNDIFSRIKKVIFWKWKNNDKKKR